MCETIQNLNLLKVNLHTGRSHQIRVQLASIGSPLFGDMRYGGANAIKGNIALWASLLSFTHPTTKERLVFKIEPPSNLSPWKYFNVQEAFKNL